MNKPILTTLLLYFIFFDATAQQILVMKASSKVVDVVDGNHFKKGFWYIFPEIKPDIYYVDFPLRKNTIKFVTDLDSVSVTLNPGEQFDFIILLNGKDSCYTRIVSKFAELTPHKKTGRKRDSIPFSMKGNRVYLKGTLNNSKPLDIQFDLGAGISNISHRSVKKVNITFDGKATLHNDQGSNEAPTSSINHLDIAGLQWDSLSFIQTKNMNRDEDLIVGNSLFQNKVLEVNYDKFILTILDTLPSIPYGYSKHEIILEQHRPIFKSTLTINSRDYTDWFVFDTGNNGSMWIREDFSRQHNVWSKYKRILGIGKRHVVIVPKIKIGETEFEEVIANASKPEGKNASGYSIIGNELLKRYNFILDNQNGCIYLKPNHFMKKR
jgi:hypothetical protein